MTTEELEPLVPQPRGSRGVALTNWFMSKTSNLLERTSSRRGFLVGSALVGSAVAVTGCDVFIAPGPPYTHITDCGPSACTDGWTEFCCVINGVNSCPPGSFPAGWWRADYSSFCNGTRYYIDCNQTCCGPLRSDGFCAGCEECRCANGCNTRRVYCNYFRYGQCHTEIPLSQTGPIACRIVTCVPPWSVDPTCINSPAVDNATAEHSAVCPVITPKPKYSAVLPQSAAVVVPSSGGNLLVAARDLAGAVSTRTLLDGSWTPWFSLGGAITSGIALAAASGRDYLVARGVDDGVYANQRVGLEWSGWRPLGGTSRSDPVTVADGTGVQIFIRGTDDALWALRLDGTSATPWFRVGGQITSEPTAVREGSAIRIVARGNDDSIWTIRYTNSWSEWERLGGTAASDPICVTHPSGTYVFIRGIIDASSWVNRFNGSTWSGWQTLGGASTSDPAVDVTSAGPRLFIRGTDHAIWTRAFNGSTWSGWGPLGGAATASPVAITGNDGEYVFIRGTDAALWFARLFPEGWTGWVSLSGGIAPVRPGL